MSKYDVIVIGGGAAGMMAASRASKRNKKVLLVDQKDKLGSKILITGKGRCNITNGCDIEDIIKNTVRNSAFLYSSIYTFSNMDIIKYFNDNGLETKEERGKRIFPASDKASHVRNAMLNDIRKSGVDIRYNTRVSALLIENGVISGIKTDEGDIFESASVIVACGGKSYPMTGSDGSGFLLAKNAGHHVTALQAGLTGLNCKEHWTQDAMGITLKNVTLTAVYDNRKLYSDIGEMIFTHFGVSGPLVLTASRYFLDTGFDKASVIIDLKPGLSDEKLYDRIGRDLLENSKKKFENSLHKLLPSNLIDPVISLSGIDREKQCSQITKEERNRLVYTLKNLTLKVQSGRGFDEAIVTVGGVDTKEINPSTMESKLVKGLFFAGEIIDIDALTGGFNLTIAFSTGYLAGDNA
ncbi:MAG: aminoacetone oxidase family FAD-binding enzyme [Clostridia bacterium]|nr:aminoacetone oxidase family FAD-binding enzyme [Clostridia bacterium]